MATLSLPILPKMTDFLHRHPFQSSRRLTLSLLSLLVASIAIIVVPELILTGSSENSLLRCNAALALRALTVSAIYIAGTVHLGRGMLLRLAERSHIANLIVCQAALGAIVLSLLLSAVAILNCAYAPIILTIGFLPAGQFFVHLLHNPKYSDVNSSHSHRVLIPIAAALLAALLIDINLVKYSDSTRDNAWLILLCAAPIATVVIRNRITLIAQTIIKERILPRGVGISPWRLSILLADCGLAALLSPYLTYVLLICIAEPCGPDMAVYHLEIPRNTIDHHAFIHNHFSYAGGLQYGWHMFGLPVFLVSGDRGYQCLSFAAFLAILSLAYQFAAKRDFANECGDYASCRTNGLIGTCAVAAVLVGISRECISNNDLGAIGTELLIAMLAVGSLEIHGKALPIVFGLLTGWALAIKLTTIPGVCIAYLFYFKAAARKDFVSIVRAIALTISLGSVWPLITFINTGSPLPQHLASMRFQGPPFPHFHETMQILNKHYGTWYFANWPRMLTGGNLVISVTIFGIAVGSMLSPHLRRHVIWKSIICFAMLRWILAALLQPHVVLHDRYHLVSLSILSLSGAIGWLAGIRAFSTRSASVSPRFRLLPTTVAAIAGVLLVWMQLHSGWTMALPIRPPNGADVSLDWQQQNQASLLGQQRDFVLDFYQPRGIRGPHAEAFEWIRHNLPSTSIIAGTSIAPYGCQRHYLQISPVAQDCIDLQSSPNRILETLVSLGATHLHLHAPHTSAGVMPWATPEVERWSFNLRRISNIPGVKCIAAIRKGGQIVDWVFDIRPAPQSHSTLDD